MTNLMKAELEDVALFTAILFGPTVVVAVLITFGIFFAKFLDFAIHL